MNFDDYDFCGWATRNDIRCSDGRTIRQGAFTDNDGEVVPLVWNHQHNGAENVLGHALLVNYPEGVYTYGKFNDTDNGQRAKILVDSGDIDKLSIYANGLKQNGGDVVHGRIREVSLVLAGANPGAYIESIISHNDDGCEDEEAYIYSGEEIELFHADSDQNDEGESEMSEPTIAEIIESMTDEQRDAMTYIVAAAIADKEEEDDNMKHNIFDSDYETEDYLTHADMESILNDAKRNGSLKDAFLAHADDYGIQDIDMLFPEPTNLNNPPEFIKRDTDWVSGVISGVHHVPFSRIKSSFANITEDEARAKGYIKGKYKKEEVFTLLKRSTAPTTIYKKQKLDRDDVVDITDFDVVAWIKSEMRMMLDEEIARAILVGDGRMTSDDDHISEQAIRPVWKDEDLFCIKADIGVDASATEDEAAKAMIRAAVKARKDYKGSGNPVFYTTEDWLTNALLLEDGIGHRLYKSESELATAMRVSKIVTVPVMENLSRNDGQGNTKNLVGLIVNLSDYSVGADKGGAINMFDDFDIDYNQQKYLIETRCSGALTKPYSAIALEMTVNG